MAEERGHRLSKRGHGQVDQLVIRSVANGCHTDLEIRRAVKALISGESLVSLLRKLVSEHLLSRSRGRYYVGPRAAQFMPQALNQQIPMAPYVAPKPPPRRAGSSTNHIPSMVCGQRVEYRPHV